MEFWGVEVKAGESLKVKFEDDKILHLSQAALGESKKEKGNESIPLFLKVDQQKLVLGTLSPANIPQLSFDLVFDKEFELSHNWKNGSVFFLGYKSVLPEEEEFSEFDDSDSGEDLPINTFENGKPEPKVEQAKAVPTNANAAKAKVKVEEPPKVAKGKEDDDDDSDEDMDDEDSDEDESDEDMSDAEDGSDEGSESENEETPKKAEPGKKRPTPTESATKTPVPAKKAKLVSPQKTDGKKGGAHTATPHPNKKAGKTPASSDKGKGQSPKSGGQVSCKSCSKTFNSENALQSHAKAKHATS